MSQEISAVSSNVRLDFRSQSADIQRFEYLDALRGIAILGVVLVHSAILSRQEGLYGIIGFTGQRGVQLFYMVSAFTIFLSLDSGRTEHFRWSNFFIRRFCRIAPLFYLAIIANLLLNGLVIQVQPHVELSKIDILSGFLFVHWLLPNAINNVAMGGWSIAVEATFYFLVPILFTRIKTLSHAITFFLFTVLVFGTISFQAAARVPYLKTYFSFLWFPVEFPVFALGMVAYMAWKKYVKPATTAEVVRLRRDLSMLLMIASIVLYLACLPFDDRGLYLSSFLFLPLMLALAMHPWEFLVNRFTRFLGKISFSVYLCHFFVQRLVAEILNALDRLPSVFATAYLLGNPLGLEFVFLLTLAISIPLCTLTWKFVEQPGIRAGKNWIRHREQRVANLRHEGNDKPAASSTKAGAVGSNAVELPVNP
jgi:peptidoglycan/LPS O-acetylase OafA/YrhL